MGSYNTLFVEPEARKISLRPSALLLSAFLHTATVGLVLMGFLYMPKFRPLSPRDLYMMRQVELNRPAEEAKRAADSERFYPGAHVADQKGETEAKAQAPSTSQRQFERLRIAEHTVIQPDIPQNKLVMQQAALPAVLLWSTPTKMVKVLAPPIQHPSNTILIHPTITRPNNETAPSDIPLTSTAFTTLAPMPAPSASSPIAVTGPSPTPRVPETSSLASTLPSSAAVISISDTKATNGVIALAPVNQTAAGSAQGAMMPGHGGNAMVAGNGDASSKGLGSSGAKVGGVGSHTGAGAKPGDHASLQGQPNEGNGSAAGHGANTSVTQISRPPNGQYNVVVVGSNLEEQFPEIQDVWGSRLVYTVYLHVGLSKSWILQYTLPSNAAAESAGNMNHLEAPWPYSIVRPNFIPAEVSADALMIHGFVNQAGHFESLGFAFSPGSVDLHYILSALQQWQFRPARLNGQVARVEVLVIVPLEQD